jgi:hypothetical protein
LKDYNYGGQNMQNNNPWYIQYGPLMTASATFIASLIALFKEDIISLWKKPKLKILLPNNGKFKEISVYDFEDQKSNPVIHENDHIIVNSYDFVLDIINDGKEPCKDCELYLEQIKFKKSGDVNYIDLSDITGKPIIWQHKNISNVNLPPYSGKITSTLIKILSPEQLPRSKDSIVSHAGLQIGDVTINKDNMNGDYIIKYALYSLNCKPKRISINFKWNGTWESRITEFEHTYKIELMEVKS